MTAFLRFLLAFVLTAASVSAADLSGQLHKGLGFTGRFPLAGVIGKGISPPPGFNQFFIDFANGGAVGGAFPNLTTTRTTTNGIATSPDINGVYKQFANNVPRITNGRGLWSEETRTNGIRNNTMVGALPGADDVELITNSNFALQGAGYTTNATGGGSVTITTGIATVTGDGTTFNNYFAQQITGLIVGRNYVVSISGGNNATFAILVGIAPGSNSIASNTSINANGAGSVNPDRMGFTATATSAWVTFSRFVATPGTLTSVSVQDGERAQNGSLLFNPINAVKNVVQNGWQWSLNGAGTGTVVWNGSNLVTLTGDGTNAALFGTQTIPTIVGATYIVTVDVGGAGGTMFIGTAALGGQIGSFSVVPGVGQQFEFTATTTTSFVTFSKIPAVAMTVTNVSVQSAGKLPTNWTATSFPVGTTITVNGTVQINGLTALSVSINGTNNSGAAAFPIITSEGSLTNVAAQGQTWSVSGGVQVSGTTSQSWGFHVVENNNGSFLGQSAAIANSFIGNPFAVVPGSYTMVNNATNHTTVTFGPSAALAIGATINQTLLLAANQLELNPLINATIASATPVGGTGYAVNDTGTVTGGAPAQTTTYRVTAVTGGVPSAVVIGGTNSYTTLPASPAATAVGGVQPGVGTGMTLTLTPTNNAALGFSTTPILTSGNAGVRGAERNTVTTPPSYGAGTAYSVYWKGALEAPPANASPSSLVDVSTGGSTAQRTLFRRDGTSGNLAYRMLGGSSSTSIVGGFTSTTTNKGAASVQVGPMPIALNGAAGAAANPAALPTTPTQIDVGNDAAGANPANGYTAAFGVNPTTALSQVQLNAATTLP